MRTLPIATDADVLDEFEKSGWSVSRSQADRYFEWWQETQEFAPPLVPPVDYETVREAGVSLGFLGLSHLGDVLCSSTLPRKIKETHGVDVFFVRHRSTINFLMHNPFVSGFRNEGRIALKDLARGTGHIIQKLERSFGVPLEPFPRPEIYLSDDEHAFAWKVRATLPRDRPLAVICTNSITDNMAGGTANYWRRWAEILGQRYCVVQPALTTIEPLEEVVRLSDVNRSAWRPDEPLDNCYVLENLRCRQFLSLFSVADFYLGPNSGGAHAAAAFDIPSLVILPRRQYPHPPNFPDRIQGARWRHESFLYPQHDFLHV